MPYNDDAARRTARERSQARIGRYSGSDSRSSTDSYGRARQESDHLSQSRYSRQTPRQTSQSSRDRERPARQERSERTTRTSNASRSRQDTRQASVKRRQPTGSDQRRSSQGSSSRLWSLLERIPGIAVIAAGIVILILLFALIFAVIVPSCSKKDEPAQPAASSQATPAHDIVYTVGQKAKAKREQVETANQVGSLETSNSNVEALVSLLGEEEAAKLLAQAKTNPDALWIAAHPDEYAFDGIEIQYKILKLAADEPASIPYVREFPSKYPANEPVDDKSLAMDVASPSDNVPTTSTPHLYQWDRRWAYTIYSSASFGMTGCGPTSLAMVYQGLNRTVDKSPYDIAAIAEERGFMSEFNGTDSAFFTEIAGELGLNCWESYPDAANIVEELNAGHVIIVNLGPGYFTTNGHFFVLAGLDKDGKVIVNDPYSVVRSSQTWDADFIATETMAMFVYSKA